MHRSSLLCTKPCAESVSGRIVGRFQFLVKLLRAARQVQGEHSRRRAPPGKGERIRTRIRIRTRTCMMHMDRAPEVVEAAKELSSR